MQQTFYPVGALTCGSEQQSIRRRRKTRKANHSHDANKAYRGAQLGCSRQDAGIFLSTSKHRKRVIHVKQSSNAVILLECDYVGLLVASELIF